MDMRLSSRWSRRAGMVPRAFGPTHASGRQSRDSPVIDLAEGRVTAPDGTVTELRRQSAEVLRLLAARAGHTVPKSEIIDGVWGDVAVTEDSLVQCIAEIRRALGSARDRLHTAHRSGYRLELDAAAPGRRARPRLALAGAFALAALLALGAWLLRDPPAPPGVRGPVVAVLPFENLAGGERWDRLARGVTEEVIADLASNPWIFVLADAATRPHAGETPQAVAAALGAGHVVTGTIQAGDGRVRIAAALADPGSGRQVWARQWEGSADDLLKLQTAAAEALVGELAGHWSGAIAAADRARAHEASTQNLDAYDLYLLGIEHKHRMTPHDFDLAETYLLRAVAIDPNFAKAWVGLSIVLGFKTVDAVDEREVAELLDRLRGYTARAIEADPDDPSTLLEAARVAAMDGDPESAERSIRRAVERAPNDADILAVAAWSGPGMANIYADADAWSDRALALNPAAPSWYMAAKGTAAFAAGDYPAAIAALRAAPQDFAETHFFIAAAAAKLGDVAAATTAAGHVRRLVPSFSLATFLAGAAWVDGDFRDRLQEGAVRAGLGD
jgi:TolB-like protein/DNA-binding winged helix-turn-helix (wHTH) protein